MINNCITASSNTTNENSPNNFNQDFRKVQINDSAVKLWIKRRRMDDEDEVFETTLLHDATASGNLEWTQYLLSRGFNINARDIKGKTPLRRSLEGRHYEVVQLLLNAGADISGLLHLAVKLSDAKGVKLLLDYGADVEELNHRGATPIYYSYFRKDIDGERERDNIEILRTLLNLNASLMTLSSYGCFQIRSILFEGSREAVRLVLQSEIDFNAKDEFGNKTMLHYLAMNRDPTIVEELKPYIGRFDLNALNDIGGSPLREAVARGNIRMAEFLLEHGARVDLLCREHRSTVLWSAFDNAKIGTPEEYEKGVELLLQYNIDPQVTIKNKRGETVTIVDLARITDNFDKLEFVIAQLAIRKKQKLLLTEPTRSKIRSHAQSKVYLKKCQRFLENKIAGTVNVFKLLTTSDKKMKKYLNNQKLMKKLLRISHKQELRLTYKYYFNTFKKRFSKVFLSKTLKDKAAKVICQLLQYRVNELDIVTEKIIGYLNNEDLRLLCLM